MIPLERAPAAGVVPGYEWRPGDALARVGRTPLRDILDFYYLGEEAGEVEISIVDADGTPHPWRMDTGALSTLAESFAPMEFKTCAAQCVFCFIDQNPKGLRDNLYVKDEDYRFSFLYGNYITLTSLGRRGLQRVIEQRLSPLFVSVHATDVDARTRLLGIRKRIDVMGILRQLAEQRITVHTQIVLCPGWNDGEVLDRTLDDLGSLYPQVASIAVVPVGLTDHREGLTELRPVTDADAHVALEQIGSWGERSLRERGHRLAWASDEFHLMVDAPLPDATFYEGLEQEDTGIGICRSLLDELDDALDELRAVRGPRRTRTVLTGTLAARFFERDVLPRVAELEWLDLRVVGVTNRLYGAGITVSGLLAGRDLLAALEALPPDAGTVLLPDTPINHDGLFLDDLSLDELMERSPHPVRVGREGLVEELLRAAREV